MLKMLFVPGIKGTELTFEDDNVWFPKNLRDMETLNFKNPLKPGRLLRSVTAFTYIHVDVYKGIIDSFEQPFFDFYRYDWRQNLITQVDGLVEKITSLVDAGDEVILVAHSMGGMLAKLAILELQRIGRLEGLKKLITLGTPWHGAPDAYKALAYGEPGIFPRLYQSLMFLDDKKTRRMARQFPSVFQLLPSEHYFESEYGKFLYNPYKDKEYMDVIQEVSGFFKEENEEFVDVWTNYMKPIQEAMLEPLPDGFQHDCLIGNCRPTLYQVPDNKLFTARVFFKADAVFMNGDGVVPIFSAKPIHAANLYFVDGEHHEFGSNQTVIDFIKWSINGKTDVRPVGIQDEAQDELHNGFMARIKCPVNPTFLDEENRYVAGQFDPSIEEVSELSKNPRLMYFPIGDSKYLFIPENEISDLKVKVTSYEKGIADISLQVFDEEVTEVKFEPLPVEKGETAVASLPLTKKLENATLKKAKGTEYEYSIVTKKSVKDDITIKRPSIPTLEILVKAKGDTKKVPYNPVFSGPVSLAVKLSDEQLVDVVYYTVDGQDPIIYKETVLLDLAAGEHKVEVFGKDIYGRPLKPRECNFSIDTVAPFTKPYLVVTPEGLDISFSALTLGTKVSTHYKLTSGPSDEEENDQWGLNETGSKINVPWGELVQDKNEFVMLQYYSENPFGPKEDVKSLMISLGDIPNLMWEEEASSYITPEIIWSNVLKNNFFAISDFSVTFIGKGMDSGTFNEMIADNVKGILFESSYLHLSVMYDEKYALFFIGPPTEVLTVGQEYKFSFELLTERSKDKIRHTNPRASLRASRSALPDKQIPLEDIDGTFKGKFNVDDKFKKHKFRLVITDQKNTNPSLREIPLTLKEIQD
ncbi:lipase/acyltransferase domain-containing protein [Paenibacillus polymyxa]|uniref:lipase/acyltransferase domain-containing protein n=1 Tax=Paenibacillus polymyxa TaxID=1406 RepID=UPI00083D7A02|nr:hypothetical protein [Paenibacillus polymyxa]ODB61657.1 hypothetical protein A7309_14230 [Paenibacillus polymyxa]